MMQILQGLLPHDQQRRLEEWAPAYFTAPTGSRIRIDYRDELAPVVAVRTRRSRRAQLAATGRGSGAGDLQAALASAPSGTDHARSCNFLAGIYAEVRKDMRGRYPRHYWPEDPAIAEPTRRAKPPGGKTKT